MSGSRTGGQPVAPAPAPTAPTQPNIYDTSAGAYNTAVNTTQQGMNYQPAQLANTDMQAYQNPYQQQVIDNSLNDLERSRQMQMNQLGASATQAGAFGGSRHGVAEAQTNEGFGRQAGNLSALMNSQGWDQAQNSARFDINNQIQGNNSFMQGAAQLGNLSGLGFGMGNTLNSNMLGQGTMQQQNQQQLIDAAKAQYAGYTSSPYMSSQIMSGALAASPNGQGTTTQSSDPGLLGYITGAAGAAGSVAPYFMTCWVAREVYGPSDPKWLQFREYLLDIAPAWFRNLYIKHGAAFAGTVKRHPWMKKVLRPLMDMGRRKAGY